MSKAFIKYYTKFTYITLNYTILKFLILRAHIITIKSRRICNSFIVSLSEL